MNFIIASLGMELEIILAKTDAPPPHLHFLNSIIFHK